MTAQSKLSNILFAAALGASTAYASGNDVQSPTAPTSQANTNVDYTTGSQNSAGSSANVINNSTVTISNTPYKAPKIVNESYNLGPCSGSAYQGFWQTIKMSALFEKHGGSGVVDIKQNSVTIRQHLNDSDAERKSSAEFFDRKKHPSEPKLASANDSSSASTGAYGNASNVTTDGASATYKVPEYYKHITYKCTLGQ